MFLVGLCLGFQGAFPHVLDGHGGHDDDEVFQAAQAVGLHQHAGHPWVHRDTCQVLADRGQYGQALLFPGGEGAEFVEQ